MHRRHISTSSKAADSIAGILSCYQTLRDARGNHRNVFWDAKEASKKGRGILKQTNKQKIQEETKKNSQCTSWCGKSGVVMEGAVASDIQRTWAMPPHDWRQGFRLAGEGSWTNTPPPIQLWDTGNSKNPLPKETKEDWDRDYHKVSQERHISISTTLQDISGLWQNHHKATKRPEISLKGQSKHREKILIQPQHWDYQTRNLKYDHHTKLGLERRNKQHARNMETLEGI